MELKEFIKESLTQISEGVIAANKAIREKDGQIDTSYLLTSGKDGQLNQKEAPTKVCFDIAVTSTTSFQGDAKAKAKILAVVDASLEGSTEKERQDVSRVKFEVTVSKNLGYSKAE